MQDTWHVSQGILRSDWPDGVTVCKNLSCTCENEEYPEAVEKGQKRTNEL